MSVNFCFFHFIVKTASLCNKPLSLSLSLSLLHVPLIKNQDLAKSLGNVCPKTKTIVLIWDIIDNDILPIVSNGMRGLNRSEATKNMRMPFVDLDIFAIVDRIDLSININTGVNGNDVFDKHAEDENDVFENIRPAKLPSCQAGQRR